MREQHLYFLALVSGLFGGLGACQGAGDVAGIFVDVTWYSALRHLWATSDLEGTLIAVGLGGAVVHRRAMNLAICLQRFARWAGIFICLGIEAEVSA